jgi:serine/threonine-protein kinase
VIDVGEDLDPAHPRPYIVFEYVEGETLKDRIRRLGRLPIAEAVAYTIEIARALGAAHARHIVHRDVKPQNVLIDEDGSAKVTDFGIARTLDEEGLTADGRVLGTTDYVAPEQALGQDVTGQSDLYSLGIVLWEMLTGEVPFKGDNQVAVAMKHVREELPDIQTFRPEVSAALAAVIDSATAKRQKDRYADDAEFISDLEDVLAIETARAGSATGEVTTVLRSLPLSKKRRVPLAVRHRTTVALALLSLLLVGGGIAGWLATRTHHGTGTANLPPPITHNPKLGQVQLCQTCAHGFNPLGSPTDESPNAEEAIDQDRSTYWQTQQYYDKTLNKAGVGLYVDASPGTAAKEISVISDTPGFTATIYASKTAPPVKWPSSNWVPVSSSTVFSRRTTTLPLSTGGTAYSYYLVWITDLGQQESVQLNEVRLYATR